ncbi:hypothetical protein L3Y34_019103 [Caenorhabditis briggsae]|uniref:BRCT domain-containing protein n=1 Tax=Caenorhabditis briggsae TaxID=6238 RepID=A0AAE9DMG8_CAEBR|nr:hypothetical protein L3Y34_019103 [Caenorhabditis briggsae]
MGICSLALWNLVKVLELKTPLLKIGEFNEKVKTSMTGYPGLTNYIHAKGLIQDFLDQAEGIEKEAKQLKDTDPLKMATVFAKMANLKGVPDLNFWNMHFKEAINHTDTLLEFILDFATYQSQLLDGRLTVNALSKYFDEIFGHVKNVKLKTTTYFIVKTDENGILETDNLSLLFWMFHGCIIVKEKWMTDCLKNEKLIEQDYNYLVEKVKYNGKVFDTVIQWSQAMAKSELPYLYGVQVAVVMKECPNLFMEPEFVEFMLKRDIHKDTNENPVSWSVGSHFLILD